MIQKHCDVDYILENYLDQLNSQQRDAVVYMDGPQLVIAGAGSGKTRVLTYKIVHLINEGYEPWRIMALTFTNKAAREMRERIEPLVGKEVASKLWMGTFHSIFYRILRLNAERLGFKHDFTIYDTSDSLSLIKQIVKGMQLDEKLYKPSALQSRFSMMKNAMFSPADYASNADIVTEDRNSRRPLTAKIYASYCKRCRIAGAMDFDDLLFYTNLLLRDNPDVLQRYEQQFRYVLIDEYQDTNFAQYLIVKQLTAQRKMFCIVGDDAQSIYSFRGANISNILGLEKQYPQLKTFKLEQNYRSTQNIIAAANSLIEKNQHQIPKHIFSKNDKGRKVQVVRCMTEYEEAFVIANTIAKLKREQGSSWDDFAILYRTNAQSRSIEKALASGGLKNDHGNTRMAIPYRIYGGLAFYQRKEVKDAICYFRITQNPDDDEALRRIINYPTRGIGETTLKKIQATATDHGVSMWQVISAPESYNLAVNKGTLSKLLSFKSLIDGFIELNSTPIDAHELATKIIERSQLLKVLMSDNTPENISRQENLNELLSSTREFVESKREETGDEGIRLADYMKEVSLATDQDTSDGNQGPCVTLMTVHAAKGLEFKNVMIAGVEEDRFPSYKSKETMAQIEEERRLFYVAITRAKTVCTIFHADTITLNGQMTTVTPSRFIGDIDPQLLTIDRTSFYRQEDDLDFDNERSNWNRSGYQASSPRGEHEHEASTPRHAMPARPVPMPRRLTPMSTARSASATATASGKFTIHNIEELSKGTLINHARFGQGTIEATSTQADPKITVNFNSMGLKTLLLKFAKFEIIK